MNVTFAHAIGDTVVIISIQELAMVESLILTQNGNQYRVAYWFNGKRESEVLYACEIKKGKYPLAARKIRDNQG